MRGLGREVTGLHVLIARLTKIIKGYRAERGFGSYCLIEPSKTPEKGRESEWRYPYFWLAVGCEGDSRA